MIESTTFPLPGAPRPVPDADSEPFWRGLADGKILAPRCAGCDRFHFPPLPCCPYCGQSRLEWPQLDTRPVVYSWIVVRRATHAGIPVPYTVVLAEFAEGVRIPGNMAGDASATLRLGTRLSATIAGRDGVHVVVYERA